MSLMDRIAGRTPPLHSDDGSVDADIIDFRPGPSTPAYSTERGLVASAEKIDLKKKNGVEAVFNRPWGAWQADAWEYFDAIGEIKYAYSLLGAVMSRLRIYAALNLDPDSPPASTTVVKRRENGQSENEKIADKKDELAVPDDITLEVMTYMEQMLTSLGSGHGGIPGLLRSFAINISVAGECYLCKIENRWSFRSTEEILIRETDRTPVLRVTRSQSSRLTGSPRDKELPKNTYIGRIWKPHPRYSGEPDSSLLGLREVCDELLTLQRMIRATARSRMNAGLLFVPDGISAASSTITDNQDGAEEEADPFELELMQALVNPVGDEASAATVVPMVARGPKDLGDGIKYMTFNRDSDRALVERTDKVLNRIMQGLDVPKDLVTGLANVKYSNAVKIDDSLYKSHIEPLALLLCDSLTMIYLRPAIRAKFPDISVETLNKIVIWYDPTEVVSKPDPASAAATLYENIELSGAALRRSNGFSDTDAPSEKEIAERLAIRGAPTAPPEVVTALIKNLLPSIFQQQQEQNAAQSGMPESARQMLYPNDSSSSDQSGQASPSADGQNVPVDTGGAGNLDPGNPSTSFDVNAQGNMA